MANITITNVDTGSVELRDGEFQDATITFAGADVYAPGTLLAVLTAAPAGAYVLWVNGAADGSEIPKAVLTYELEAAGAGDETARVLVGGVVNSDRLLEDATGDGSNIDAENIRQLQDVGITALSTEQLAVLDNQ